MSTLATIFLPTETNGGLPRALSSVAFAIYFVIAAVLLLSPATLRIVELASLTAPAAFGPAEVISLVNESRAAQGLAPLKQNSLLEAAAIEKTEDIFTKQYFAHVSPSGRTPWNFIRGAGYVYQAAGENLAIDYSTARDAHASLMASPTHRANILGPLYTEIGVAVRQGTFEGHPSILIVQYFGKPQAAAAAKAAAKPKAPAVPAKSAPQPVVTSAPKTPEVLGVEEPDLVSNGTVHEPVAVHQPSFVTTGRGVKPAVQVISLALLAILLIALTFAITRLEHLPMTVAFKSLILIAFFGYLVATGGGHLFTAKITPSSFSNFEVEEAV